MRLTATVKNSWPAHAAAVLTLLATAAPANAQSSPADQRASAALAESPAGTRDAPPGGADEQLSMSFLELTLRGGYLMIPIGLISVVVVAIGVERATAIRRRRLLPPRLVSALHEMARRGAIDTCQIQQLCALYPSSLSRVVESLLSKLGRPLNEQEQAVNQACQRESDELYANVRTLNLATSVAPLLGLLGTVSGMIQAFFMTAHLPMNVNKGEALAEGIYIALVTTFAGLSVAIPAAVLVHFFESRILRLVRDIEQLVGTLLPNCERLVDKRHIGSPLAGPHTSPKSWPITHPESKAS